VDEDLERWNEHYQQMLNHAPASLCPELDDAAANAAPAGDVRDDAPAPGEVKNAIRKLRNGRVAVIISLYKGKGSRTVCSNHRPLLFICNHF